VLRATADSQITGVTSSGVHLNKGTQFQHANPSINKYLDLKLSVFYLMHLLVNILNIRKCAVCVT